jgi:LmbE family N-acetylglucosaminyl deacetylase
MAYFFISPHLDDAILSAGNLIFYLKKKNPVKVITVFTRGANKTNSFTQNYIKKCGYNNQKEFFIERKKEDTRVLKTLKIKPIHLNFIDAVWREQGKNLKKQRLEKKITLALKEIIKVNNENMVFCPIGIGKHVDHLIIRNICQKTFRKVVYWQDYPYVLWDKADQEFIRKNKLKKTIFGSRFNKNKLIMGYKSQTKILFNNQKIKTVPEQYFFQEKPLFI